MRDLFLCACALACVIILAVCALTLCDIRNRLNRTQDRIEEVWCAE